MKQARIMIGDGLFKGDGNTFPFRAASNLKKYGVSFEEAVTVFDDYNALVFDDPDHSEEEERFVIIGTSRVGKTIFVSHCWVSLHKGPNFPTEGHLT